MPISPEIVSKVSDLQNQIWPSAALKASESAGFELSFTNPLTTSVSATDIFADANSPRLVIQFSLASLPENSMVLMIPQETYAGLTGSLRGTQMNYADEGNIPEVKSVVEAVIHGICQAIGMAKNEPVAPTGISFRFQIPSFPPNLQRNEDNFRVNVGFSCEDFSGTVTWVLDAETGHFLIGEEYIESHDTPFNSVGGSGNSSSFSGDANNVDENGLAIVMDIPLEVSVELGRVRMQVKDVVELGAGSIVEIDKAAGEPVDVLVNNRLVARGEVVVIDDNFGVRITEILSIQDRLQKLNEVA